MRGSSCTELIVNEDSTVSGIMLGHNYCSEHEWGVDELRRDCGGMVKAIADEKRICNFKRIAIQVKPEDIIWHEEKGLVIMGMDKGFMRYLHTPTEEFLKKHKLKADATPAQLWAAQSYEFFIPKKLTPKDKADKWPPKQTVSAWDGGSFGIATREPEIIAFLKDLKEAMIKGDAVLHVSGTGNPFKPTQGLVLAIGSRIPQEQKDAFKAGYEDRYKLLDAAEKTGIEKKLKKAGLRWFALSPRWNDLKERICGRDEKGEAIIEPVNSKYPVMFWLNPYDQNTNNSMWCTVEDLEAWIKNEGPIPTKKAAVR